MNIDQIIPYIGIPHKPGGEGPDAYDCWHLLRHLQKEYFGVEMPLAPIGDEEACLALFKDKTASGDWVHVEVPQHGDCVLLRGGMWPHVGIYLDLDGGGVLHAMEDAGIIWTRLPRLRALGFGRTTYYRVSK